MKNYHREGGAARCTLKIGLMKAYDLVDWDFSIGLSAAIWVSRKLINWVETSIITPKASVANNGEPGWILFVTAMEYSQG